MLRLPIMLNYLYFISWSWEKLFRVGGGGGWWLDQLKIKPPQPQLNWGLGWAWQLDIKLTGCPTKKFTVLKPVYLRPLISLSKSSVLKMNLWISSFKNTNLIFFRFFVFRDIKGIRYHSPYWGYSWHTFDNSEIIKYFELACSWPKMIIIQV